ncbi:MAG TPA: AAA family ATPase [Anaerolineales bacterium]
MDIGVDRMKDLFLSTKIHIPHLRTNKVSRARLTKRLRAGIDQPGSFALLSGPAGFGKTTLICEFAANLPERVTWLSLDEADNDPSRFWTYLIRACQSVYADIGESALAGLRTPGPMPPEVIPTLLINDVAMLKTGLVLVLDDYHVIQNQTIHSGIGFMLDHLSDNLHLIISTRVDPPLSLARFRARGQLIELRAADLRFTSEETDAFLNQVMQLGLSAQEVNALEARTEGWIASLQLAGVSMSGRSDLTRFIDAFTGSHIYVAEYLMEEVLGRQPEEINTFLLQTSMLERLNASLCEAVTGRADSPALLREVYRANLFLVALDEEGQWFRYHHLFADLLKARLQQSVSIDEIAALHRSASSWYEQSGLVDEAIHHALAAHDFERAAQLVEKSAYQATIRGELTTLLRWMEGLPEHVIQRHPQILISKAWILTLAGSIRQVEPLLQQAETQIGSDEESDSARYLLGNVAAIRGFFAMMMGDYIRALELAERADALLPEDSVHARWLVPYTLGAAYRAAGEYTKAIEAFGRQARMGEKHDNLIIWATGMTEVAIVQRLQGRLRDARDTCRRALRHLAERGGDQFGSLAKLEVPLIEVLREQNELEEAHQRITDVLARMQAWPMPTDRLFAFLALIQLQEAQGDLEGALETLRTAKDLRVAQPVLKNLARSIDLWEVRLALKSGDVATAARLIEALDPSASHMLSTREQEGMMLARVRLAQGRADEA